MAKEKPPIFGMIQRCGAVVIRMLANVKQATIGPQIERTISKGTAIYTDEYDTYGRLVEWGYGHETVCHGTDEYARDDDGDGPCELHVNTMEGSWSLLRSWLRPHRGIPQETFGNKRSTTWTGYKVHLTETCDEKQVHLITNVETSLAVTADVDLTAPIHTALAARDLLPDDHYLDAGYVDGELLVGSQEEHGVRLVGPVRPDVSWQAQANQGDDIAQFRIDWDAERVTCPEGRTSVLWKPTHDAWGNAVIHAEFARPVCLACRTRPLCTRAKTEGREMTLRPREQHEALQAARVRQETPEWRKEYGLRVGVEGTISQGVRVLGLQRCRYVGLAKARLQHVLTGAAMNLVRLAAWLSETPQGKTRVSQFARLALTG